MKILINQAACCGAGQCVAVAPDVFDQREEDGVVFLRNPEPRSEQFDAVRLAQKICPALAILVEE